MKNVNFCEKGESWLKIGVLVYLKMEMLVKNQNFGQKSKFWSEMEILIKMEISVQNLNFCLDS